MNLKRITLAVAGAMLVIGCAGNNVRPIDPKADAIKPKPVSMVFNRPTGNTQLEFNDDGTFVGLSVKASAPIAGNNAFSVEQATMVATLRAKRNMAEFLTTQLNTTRTLKVLSHTVQRSLENTTNGMNSSEGTVINDRDFDTNGDPIVVDSDGNNNSIPRDRTVNDRNNANSEKIAQTVKENITTNGQALLRGIVVTEEKIDPASRTVTVTARATVDTIEGAHKLRRLMDSSAVQ